ncbi:acetyl-CoA carboxylase biotin carboxylase subunit [Rhodobacteraceae bacterium LMO-12]|nr:acetyl-CoA carboxylase biotin carboxylase subunit [Rhodobacteraceae bacterium LMO-JJ12]
MAKRDIRRVFIANRGEIAVRIIRACKRLGIETVLGVSEADQASMAAQMADEVVVLGPPAATQSYLVIEKLVDAALRTQCDAVHPGYGFLSERSEFASACEDAGIKFIGPSPQAIDDMGDKITASNIAGKAGVPRVPGSGALSDAAEARAFAGDIGYPVLVKATAGGGGRGMRVVKSDAEMETAFKEAANEAQTAFGNGTLFVEKYIQHARHVEIQVACDEHGNAVHLGERDCSTQRRHQKLIEEAPSPKLTEIIRAEMGACAVKMSLNANYVGMGTVEFVVDNDTGEYFFLEMNTRIQVEHPVTEMICGYDLVAEQIRVAGGLPLSFSQADVALKGHAIECRINAEDADRDFAPSPGTLQSWSAPKGDGIRVDSHCYDGYTIPPYYDSLIGKLIVHADTRDQAITLMRKALAAFEVGGVHTTIPFHARVLAHDDFARGEVTTKWVEDVFLADGTVDQKERANV